MPAALRLYFQFGSTDGKMRRERRILHKANTDDPLTTESHSDITPLDNFFLTVVSQRTLLARFEEHILEAMTQCVYGSNYTERVGTSLPITRDLCFAVWSSNTII